MSTKVDLRQLAVDRTPNATTPSRRRRWLTRFVLPGLLLAGFAVLLAYAARESLSPPRPVTVVPVLFSNARLQQAVDTPLFRAAGWVEPRPTPILVTALAEGVVERLLVVEGQQVEKGTVVARLFDVDARLALDAAEADVRLREGELASARAALVAARVRLKEPLHLKADLAEADAELARAETELANLPSQLRAAVARQQFAKRDWDYRQRASDVVSEASIVKSKSELEAATAAVEELQSKQKRLPALVAALKDRRDALQLRLERKTDEIRQLGEAEAAVQSAQARLQQAEVACQAARLRLSRMEIRAPAAGRVLALIARPGMRLTGLNPGSLHDSSTVLTLYDPSHLQVRVDVRLDDVAKVQPGQKVKIETAALPGRALDGEVLLPTSQADIQKNTLSVKVAIKDPPSTLKPEMLSQVTFLAPPRPPGPAPAEPYRLLIPRSLVEGSGSEGRVWVADRLSGTAQQRSVRLGGVVGDLVEVVSGLSSSDKLIVDGRDGLSAGVRIRIVGEDEQLGIAQAP